MGAKHLVLLSVILLKPRIMFNNHILLSASTTNNFQIEGRKHVYYFFNLATRNIWKTGEPFCKLFHYHTVYSGCCSTNLSKQTLSMPCFMLPIHREPQQARVHITQKKRQKRKRKKDSERKTNRRTWSEVSEGCLQRPLVMSWSVLSSSWSFGTERNVFFCPYLAKSWPAILGPRPLKMRHKWPVWATLSFTPTGERSRKKSDVMTQVLIDVLRQKEREREGRERKKKGVSRWEK